MQRDLIWRRCCTHPSRSRETGNVRKEPLHILHRYGDNDTYASTQCPTQMRNHFGVRSHIGQDGEGSERGSEEAGHRRHHESHETHDGGEGGKDGREQNAVNFVRTTRHPRGRRAREDVWEGMEGSVR